MNHQFDLTRYMIDNASESSTSISHEYLAELSLSAGKDSASESNAKANSAGFAFALPSAAYFVFASIASEYMRLVSMLLPLQGAFAAVNKPRAMPWAMRLLGLQPAP